MKKNIQTDEQIEKTMAFLHQTGLEELQNDGEVLGMIHAITADNEMVLVPLFYRSNEEKSFIYSQIKAMFKVKNVVAFYLITEAWQVAPHKDDEDAQRRMQQYSGNLSEHPDRREVLITQYVSYEEVRMNRYEMFRDADGKFTHLGEPETYASKDPDGDIAQVGGTLMELLPRPDEFTFTKSRVH